MKLWSLIIRNIKEQYRSYWILLLTLSMGPFFMMVYYLILESSKPRYDIAIVNSDRGLTMNGQDVNKGDEYIKFFDLAVKESADIPFYITKQEETLAAVESLRNRKYDALVIIPVNFSERLLKRESKDTISPVEIEFYGNLTDVNYLLSALWANEILNSFVRKSTGSQEFIKVSEKAIGSSGKVTDFDLIVPGILILSIIMLMFTATIAFVLEVENKTIIRLKLSKLSTFEFISGITIVQLFVGIISILLTLVTASLLGFKFHGSAAIFLLIAVLTSLSIIAFSLIIAAVTKTANEVLVVGNFPLFLFMFFTGAAFPFKGEGLFSISGYPVTLQGLMSPTHAISALNKIMIMEMQLKDILPEIAALIILTIIYFLAGMILFRRRHMILK
jgi:ABC-2 type transport system permease protein